jgi:N-acetylneuraminic acid mutarotase
MKHLSDRFVSSINLKKMYNMTYKAIKIYAMFFFSILAMPFLNSCSSNDTADLIGNWVELSEFDGLPRGDAVGFSIGNKGYLGTGYDQDDDRLKDFWEYDITRNTWTQKADFPGVARNGAIGFGTDTKGYIGTGYDGKNKLNDFYEYNPQTNTWTEKAPFGGSARYGATALSINNKGYVGTGYDGTYLKDFWEYNPTANTWTQKTSIGGKKRNNATSFAINGKGYLLTGIDNGLYLDDMWEYEPTTDTWTKKNLISNATDYSFDDDYLTIVGVNKVGFTINGKGYLATGGKSTGNDVWEYDPIEDLWVERYSFEGASRGNAVGFAVGNLGYVTTGSTGSSYFSDIWSFDPKAEYVKDGK